MLSGGNNATAYLYRSASVSNTNVFPVAINDEESTKFTQVRALLAETLTRIIQREKDTNVVLTNIAQGRIILHDLQKSFR
jgi:hypothetical protein